MQREIGEIQSKQDGVVDKMGKGQTCGGPCPCTKPGAFMGKCLDAGGREQIKRESERSTKMFNGIISRLEEIESRGAGGEIPNANAMGVEMDKVKKALQEVAKVGDQRYQEGNISMGRYREGLRVMNTKVDKIALQNEKEIASVKKDVEEQKRSLARMKEGLDGGVHGPQSFYVGRSEDPTVERERLRAERRSSSVGKDQRLTGETALSREIGIIQGELKSLQVSVDKGAVMQKGEMEGLRKESQSAEARMRAMEDKISRVAKDSAELKDLVQRRIGSLERERDMNSDRLKLTKGR